MTATSSGELLAVSRLLGPLRVGMLLRDGPGNRSVRVVHVEGIDGACVLFDCTDESALPETWRYSAIIDRIVKGAWSEEVHDRYAPDRLVDADSMTPGQRRSLAKRRAVLDSLLALGNGLYDPDERGALISKLAVEKTCSKPTAYTILRLYFRGGMSPAALITAHDQCGRLKHKAERADPRRKPGRPRRAGFGTGVAVTAAMRRDFDVAMAMLAPGQRKDTDAGYKRYLMQFHLAQTTLDPKRGLLPVPGTEDLIPTREQFAWHVTKSEQLYVRLANRVLRRKASEATRVFLDTSRRHVTGPGARYQIDATILDVYIVSRFDRNLIVGRPTLYAVVDVFSGAIVGMWLSLDPPNWVSAARAIVNCLEDKAEFYRQFGIDLPPGLFPSRGLAAVILGDRGELASRLAESLTLATGTVLENAPPFTPVAKGMVEGTFKTLPAKLADEVPGWVRPDYKERGGPDYRLDATLTIDELTRLILGNIVRRNLEVRHGKPLDPDLVVDGVSASPLALWNYGCEELGLSARVFDPRSLQVKLLPSAQARATRHGLAVHTGMYYGNDELLSTPWMQRCIADKAKIEVRYNPDLSTWVYVCDPLDPERIYAVELTPRCAKFANRTLAEITALRRRGKDLNDREESRQAFVQASLADLQTQIIEDATAKTLAARNPALSNAERTRDIRENRARERYSLNNSNALRPGNAAVNHQDSLTTTELDEDPDMAMLREQQSGSLSPRPGEPS